ncbi:MAG: type II toxin-antitoxin system PemK/MazF family toxin [Sphingomonadales bacterium]
MEIKQYQVALVNLEPTTGREIRKTRPCVIISPNEMNNFLETLIIAPMTTATKNYPTHVGVRVNRKKGSIALDQIRTIDKKRIVKTYNSLSQKEILNVKSILHEMLVL